MYDVNPNASKSSLKKQDLSLKLLTEKVISPSEPYNDINT